MRNAPHKYDKRILLVVTGMSPQIVTETLWALAVAQRDTPFVPTEIHVLSTREGSTARACCCCQRSLVGFIACVGITASRRSPFLRSTCMS